MRLLFPIHTEIIRGIIESARGEVLLEIACPSKKHEFFNGREIPGFFSGNMPTVNPSSEGAMKAGILFVAQSVVGVVSGFGHYDVEEDATCYGDRSLSLSTYDEVIAKLLLVIQDLAVNTTRVEVGPLVGLDG